MGRHKGDDPRETGRQLQERQDADRREAAGLGRDKVEPTELPPDCYPDDD